MAEKIRQPETDRDLIADVVWGQFVHDQFEELRKEIEEKAELRNSMLDFAFTVAGRHLPEIHEQLVDQAYDDPEFIDFLKLSLEEQIEISLREFKESSEADIEFVVDYLKAEKRLHPERFEKITTEMNHKKELSMLEFYKIVDECIYREY